jgi:hypothetical protein
MHQRSSSSKKPKFDESLKDMDIRKKKKKDVNTSSTTNNINTQRKPSTTVHLKTIITKNTEKNGDDNCDKRATSPNHAETSSVPTLQPSLPTTVISSPPQNTETIIPESPVPEKNGDEEENEGGDDNNKEQAEQYELVVHKQQEKQYNQAMNKGNKYFNQVVEEAKNTTLWQRKALRSKRKLAQKEYELNKIEEEKLKTVCTFDNFTSINNVRESKWLLLKSRLGKL